MFGLFKRKTKPQARAEQPPEPPAPPQVVVTTQFTDVSGEVLVAGTTTFARAAVERLADRHNMAPRDMIELGATIQRDPHNPVDPRAIAVLVDGEKVGALPQFASHALDLPDDASETVPYQLHILREDGKKTRAKAFVWLGHAEPQWTYTPQSPAPLTTTERAASDHAMHRDVSTRNLGPDTQLGRALRSGEMRGYTPLELIEPIKQLKREKRYEDALTMLYAAIEAEERAIPHSGGIPAPWFTEHAAICHRKLKQHEEERAVLTRYLNHLTSEQRAASPIQERLTRVIAQNN